MNVPRHELQPDPMKETFIGEGITPEDVSFSVSAMATGKPGLPRKFSWKGKEFAVVDVLEEWKECGHCRHGSGERYVRKHWFRVKTTGDLEMRIYFERQGRSSGGSRWRLYSLRSSAPGDAPNDGPATRAGNSGGAESQLRRSSQGRAARPAAQAGNRAVFLPRAAFGVSTLLGTVGQGRECTMAA